ncbi:MAG TPA: ATP-binding protein [Steroidobacteraceae bacterium]|nr:ATP-binding protein [Steroidobacteraceae bacterium]
MIPAGKDNSRQLVTVGIATVLTLVMGFVLILGFRLATQMRGNITALQSASVLQTYPATIAQQLVSLRDRLEARAYSGQALADLRITVERFDHDLDRLAASTAAQSGELDQARALWRQYNPVVNPVVAFKGQPYVDSDDAGSSFSKEGRSHFADVKRAQLFAAENQKGLQEQLAAVATQLQKSASAGAARLRTLLSAGVLAALVLAAIAAYFQFSRSRHERAAREAQEQTRDILKTVREGFFLLDADYRIGSVWSEALTRMFGRNDFAGLSFEELLKDLVPAATLATAMKYIKLLWGDRAHENLMKSINPLGQLEITMDNSHGNRETRYLQFDFHRVMGPKGIKHVLCSVGDITSSVLLAKELHESQENANAQLDMMMGMMHVDPLQLTSFLDSTETGLQLINAILREPARTDGEFRKKLSGLFRELHSIKGEASALNLMSIASRVHSLEDMVSELKKRAELSGNDFLPMVVKLDDLLAHLRSVREMASRLTTLKEGATPAAQAQAPSTSATQPVARPRPIAAAERSGGRSGEDLAPTLHSMAERLAHDHHKRFRLNLTGLADVPASYVAMVKDCIIQMLRNSAVHGIETGEARRAATKDDVGVVKVDFHKAGDGYELIFEDDGAGISPDQIKAAAVRKQILTADEAAGMDTRGVMALIFRPGFSTQETVSMDAGRGVGMDVVARAVYALGGKIGVSTNPGKFTRFKIVLPAAETARPTAAVQ